MHSSPFGFPSAPHKRYFYRGESFQRLEPSLKDSRISYAMSASRAIAEPHENDVLMGRGGKNNQHSGNERLRGLARVHCQQYRSSSKKEKSNLSRELVKQMRSLDPPARFLRRDTDNGTWEEVGDDTAREKASQVLRDAVATLSSGTPPLPPSATQHDPSQHEERLASSERLPTFSSERTPALDSVASSVTFDSQRRKRRRFFAPRRAASDSYNPYPSHATSSPIIRRHSNNPQPYFAHETRPETRASRRASLGSAASGTGLNEFDLLHGELLESDPEDHDEPLPPGNHRDLF